MSLFLFKPHVTGPEGNITTPDIVVDRLFVDGDLRPLGLLGSDLWLQAAADETARAGYAVIALGGGALISPALVLGSGPVVVTRKAWRLNNLDGHIGEVTLNSVTLASVGLPAAIIQAAGGTGDALPRGYMLVQTAAGDTRNADLADSALGRELTHRVVFEPVDRDRWGDARPKPRYSVGPMMKEVPHFI